MALPLAAIGIGANVGGGLLGNMLGQGDRDRASGILSDIYSQYQNLQMPTVEQQQINPAAYQLAGTMDPSLLQAQQLAATDAFQNINLDPRLQKTQRDTLSMLEKVAGSGFTDEDKAALQLALNKTNANEQARQQALLQQQDARGVGSSDAALAMRSASAQGQANRDAEAAMQQAIEGRARALQAATQAGSMAGNMENAAYSREAQEAAALNAREASNAQLRTDAQNRNAVAKNAAQQFNINNAQQVSNANTGAQNTAQAHNKGLYQQNYQNQLQRLSGMGVAGGAQANNLQNNANRTGEMWAGIGSGIGSGVMAMGANAAKPATGMAGANFNSALDASDDVLNLAKKQGR